MIFTSQRCIPPAATLGKQVMSRTCAVRYSALSVLTGACLESAKLSYEKIYELFVRTKKTVRYIRNSVKRVSMGLLIFGV